MHTFLYLPQLYHPLPPCSLPLTNRTSKINAHTDKRTNGHEHGHMCDPFSAGIVVLPPPPPTLQPFAALFWSLCSVGLFAERGKSRGRGGGTAKK